MRLLQHSWWSSQGTWKVISPTLNGTGQHRRDYPRNKTYCKLRCLLGECTTCKSGLAKTSLGTTGALCFLRCIKGSLKIESKPKTNETCGEGSSLSTWNLEDWSRKKLCGAEHSQAVKTANPEGLQRNWNAPFTLYIPPLSMHRDRAELKRYEISGNNLHVHL